MDSIEKQVQDLRCPATVTGSKTAFVHWGYPLRRRGGVMIRSQENCLFLTSVMTCDAQGGYINAVDIFNGVVAVAVFL